MKQTVPIRWSFFLLFIAGGLIAAAGAPGPATLNNCKPCQIALLPLEGGSAGEVAIRQLQQKILASKEPSPLLEKLGWAYVSKARSSFDESFYKLAEQTASCLLSNAPASREALLIRGHVYHALHRFKEAEELAQQLTTLRGNASDFALLGDAQLEQGDLDKAAQSYQKMIDLKPDLPGFSRIAHLRWLKGDLEGAREMVEEALLAGSSGGGEPVAWNLTKLSGFALLAGDNRTAQAAAEKALAMVSNFPPAYFAKARVQISLGDWPGAILSLQQATNSGINPEYLWHLSEAFRKTGQTNQAEGVELALQKWGELTDPRTYALYIATRKERLPKAELLCRRELQNRKDVFTYDAVAWSLAGQKKFSEAVEFIKLALRERTVDPRLYLHAAVIFTAAGERAEATRYLAEVRKLQHLLLPSELEHLKDLPDSEALSLDQNIRKNNT
jgi:tetratricopeptide (TPR) repeat protein